MQNKHLNSYLEKQLTPKNIIALLKQHQQLISALKNPSSHKKLSHLYSKLFLKQFLLLGIIKLIVVLLAFGGPIFQDLLTDNYRLFDDQTNNPFTGNAKRRYLLMNILFSSSLIASFIISCMLENQYRWRMSRIEMKIQVITQFLIFDKLLKAKVLSNIQHEHQSGQNQNHDEDESKSNINNLISIDIQTISNFLQSFHATWSSVLNLTLAMIYLYLKLKSAIFVGFAAVLILICINFCIARKIGSVFALMLAQKDQRISLTTDILHGIKQIKFLSWENIFYRKILEIREKEFFYLKVIKSLDALCVFFWASTNIVIATVSFITFQVLGYDIFSVNIFTVITLFNMLIYPLNALPWTIGGMLMAKTSMQRITAYLKQPEQKQIESNYHKVQSMQEINFYFTDNNKHPIQQMAPQIQLNGSFKWPFVVKQANNAARQKSQTSTSTLKKSSKSLNIQVQQQMLRSPPQTSQKKSFNSFHSFLDLENDFAAQQELMINEPIFQSSLEDINYKSGTEQKQPNLIQSQTTQPEIKKPLILNYIDLTFEPNNLYMIIGRVGTGKTTLLNAILNELDIEPSARTNKKRRAIQITGQIGYVAQNTWLQNKSIRDIILFGEQFKKERYEQCVEICQLQYDFMHLPDGDQYVVEANGSNLSGGQCQRIALCRALYCDPDIYLLDDVFSSIDQRIQSVIFLKLMDFFKQGKEKIVIIATSSYQFLHYASHIILMQEDGQPSQNMSKINSYLEKQNVQFDQSQIADKGGEVTSRRTYSLESLLESTQKTVKKDKNDKKSQKQNQQSQQRNDQVQQIATATNNAVTETETISVLLEKAEKQKRDKVEERREEGAIKMKTILSYIQAMGLFPFLMILLTLLLMQSFRNFFDLFLRAFISKTPFFLFSTLPTTLLTFLGISTILTLTRAFVFSEANLHAAKHLFLKLTRCIMFSRMSFFESTPIGRIIHRVSFDTQAVDCQIPFESNIFYNSVFMMVGALAIIFSQTPLVAVAVFLLSFLFYRTQRDYRQCSREVKRIYTVNNSQIMSMIAETSQGIKTIRAFGYNKSAMFQNRFIKLMKQLLISNYLLNGMSCWLSLRLQLISTAILASLLIFATILLWLGWATDANSFTLSLTYCLQITFMLTNLVTSATSTERELICLERVGQYFDMPQETGIFMNDQQKQQIKQIQQQQTSQDDKNIVIEFKNVSLSYQTHSSEQPSSQIQMAIRNISFKIYQNMKVAFVGRTGSGKTSILNIMFRLFPFQEGTVLINNRSILEYPLSELRHLMQVIPQQGFLFQGTVKQNINPEGDISDEKIFKKIDELELMDINHQNTLLFQQFRQILYNNQMIEGQGKNISNGQKQLINFLQVVLQQDRQILCLDEASSNIDPQTDQFMSQLLMTLKNQTIIMITHRMKLLQHFDIIFLMSEGKIIDYGQYEKLKEHSEIFKQYL